MAFISNFPMGGNVAQKSAKVLTDIKYTGNKIYSLKVMDGVLYHLFELTSSGTLTVSGSYTGDICLIGGGGNGGTYYNSNGYISAFWATGGGGAGAYLNNYMNRTISSGAVVIGAATGTTSYAGLSAAGGNSGANATYANGKQAPGAGGSGGTGGGGGVWQISTAIGATTNIIASAGTGDGKSKYPFGSTDMPLQCGGGAAGGSARTSYPSSDTAGFRGADGGTNGGNGGVATEVTIPANTTDPSPLIQSYGGAGGGQDSRAWSECVHHGMYHAWYAVPCQYKPHQYGFGGSSAPSHTNSEAAMYGTQPLGGSPGVVMIRIKA